MRRSLVVLLSAGVLLGATAVPALAQVPPPHEHFRTTPAGKTVQVAPKRCSRPQTQRGFVNFHEKVHTGRPSQAFARNPVGETTAVFC
jgi:hypothetical protein